MTHNIIDAVWLLDESGEHCVAETAWAQRFLQALQPHRAGGVYVNFLDLDDSAGFEQAYGDQTHGDQAEVKADMTPTTPSTTTGTSRPADARAALALTRPQLSPWSGSCRLAARRRQPARASPPRTSTVSRKRIGYVRRPDP